MLREHQWGLVCPSRIKSAPRRAENLFLGRNSRGRSLALGGFADLVAVACTTAPPCVRPTYATLQWYSIELYCRNPCSSRGRVPVGSSAQQARTDARDAGARQSKCAFSSVTCSGSQISSSADMSSWEMLSVSTRCSISHMNMRSSLTALSCRSTSSMS